MVAGYALINEAKSSIIRCFSRNNETTVTGTSFGILLTGTCDQCQVRENNLINNLGLSATFGIKDERIPSTSAVIKNYSFNNGTNFSITYTNGITLPIISGSLSANPPGLPSDAGGVLDNTSVEL